MSACWAVRLWRVPPPLLWSLCAVVSLLCVALLLRAPPDTSVITVGDGGGGVVAPGWTGVALSRAAAAARKNKGIRLPPQQRRRAKAPTTTTPADDGAGCGGANDRGSAHCPLCHFPPAPSQRPLPPDYFGQRYIWYRATDGRFNNRRVSLQHALWFARMTNRTLVVATASASGNDSPSSVANVLDLFALSLHHPIIAETQMPQGWQQSMSRADTDTHDWVDCWYLSRAEFDAQPEQAEWISTHTHTHPYAGNAKFVARFLDEELGPSSSKWNVQVLYFNAYWGYMRSTFSGLPLPLLDGMLAWTRAAFHFDPAIHALAWRIVSALPRDFIGIHWRLGDFVSMGRPVLTTESIVAYVKEHCPTLVHANATVYIGTPPHRTALVRRTGRTKRTLHAHAHAEVGWIAVGCRAHPDMYVCVCARMCSE